MRRANKMCNIFPEERSRVASNNKHPNNTGYSVTTYYRPWRRIPSKCSTHPCEIAGLSQGVLGIQCGTVERILGIPTLKNRGEWTQEYQIKKKIEIKKQPLKIKKKNPTSPECNLVFRKFNTASLSTTSGTQIKSFQMSFLQC